MHLLSLVADRLWLVKDGRVTPYEEDLESYRALLLSANSGPQKTEKPEKVVKAKRPSREAMQALKSEVRKCEDRVSKLEEMAEKLSKKLADPELYDDTRVGELEVWNKKYAEVRDAMSRAEALWMAALEKLEKAQQADAA